LFSRRFVKRFEKSLRIKFALPGSPKNNSKKREKNQNNFFLILASEDSLLFLISAVASILKIRAHREWASVFVRTHLDQSIGR
jgi:hypothetical protein